MVGAIPYDGENGPDLGPAAAPGGVVPRPRDPMNQSALSEPTLVLNRSWLPVRVCSARRAFTLLFKDAARALSPEDFQLLDFASWVEDVELDGAPFVQTVTLRIRIPEVIVLSRCDRFLRPRLAFTRRNLLRRDEYTCQYCGDRVGGDSLSVDHVVPRSAGGAATWTNCVVACRSCNARKGSRSPRQAGMRLLRSPSEPSPLLALTPPGGRWKASWDRFLRSSTRRGVGAGG